MRPILAKLIVATSLLIFGCADDLPLPTGSAEAESDYRLIALVPNLSTPGAQLMEFDIPVDTLVRQSAVLLPSGDIQLTPDSGRIVVTYSGSSWIVDRHTLKVDTVLQLGYELQFDHERSLCLAARLDGIYRLSSFDFNELGQVAVGQFDCYSLDTTNHLLCAGRERYLHIIDYLNGLHDSVVVPDNLERPIWIESLLPLPDHNMLAISGAIGEPRRTTHLVDLSTFELAASLEGAIYTEGQLARVGPYMYRSDPGRELSGFAGSYQIWIFIIESRESVGTIQTRTSNSMESYDLDADKFCVIPDGNHIYAAGIQFPGLTHFLVMGGAPRNLLFNDVDSYGVRMLLTTAFD
jgi:hypothetical protein